MKFISRWSAAPVSMEEKAQAIRKELQKAQRQLLANPDQPAAAKALLEKVSLRISPQDGMYDEHNKNAARRYLVVGLSAMSAIENALSQSGGSGNVHSVLDLPCGYGRVMRFLRARFPQAEITASEIDAGMLQFCEEEFSAKSIPSHEDFSQINSPGRFDLIWCGSLVTHIDEQAATQLMKFFCDHLAPGGLCVFTAHGHYSVELLQKKITTYGLTGRAQHKLITQFRESKYGYADYPGVKGYGISIVLPERMAAIAESVGPWRSSSFAAQGWDNHQDVYGFRMPMPGDES